MDRWKMNRIGFVNFWLYDEEDFEFADGKLLLRGQNGSGKSITTQSFIPFVLDGDRTPSRLDPFGSSDRRMEYYFLGEEGKDEATGYLFLEFTKEESKEYRTIGIGQRAKRGKPMDFWGFIILDGRRIGYELQLYKEVGTAKIPYDKRELKAQIGEENYFTDSQSEYKNHVNQYIFGFRKADQYEQFIKLLVKVRAPKLSKEFKPTKVYEILNDSLQTLTDEDLRAMVDAMEKMDEIQDSLDMLNRAFADVKVIRTEYTRYNQYMIAKKAQAYLVKKKEVETAQSRLEAFQQKKKELEGAQQSNKLRLEELEEKRKLKETERSGLLDTDLEEMDRKLEQQRQQRILREQELKAAQEQVINSIDGWIMKLFDEKKTSRQWKPQEYVLKVVEEKIRQYQSVKDAGAVQELLRADYERQRQQLLDARNDREYKLKGQAEALSNTKEELMQVQKQEELEPEREESAQKTRIALKKAGITAVPFYKTVEFSKDMDAGACARIEAQLKKMGMLDALVVSPLDLERISQACPQFLDTVLYVEEKGDSHFSGLIVSEELEDGIREMVERIISNIYQKEGSGQGIFFGKGGGFCQGIFLGKDGGFRQGILAGTADKTEAAEFVGQLARKRRREEQIRKLEEQIRELSEAVSGLEREIQELGECLNTLKEEYQRLPDFSGINDALAKEKECSLALEIIAAQCNQKEAQERSLAQQQNAQYQMMLKQSKPFPYARTEEAYEAVSGAVDDYQRIWQEVRGKLLQLGTERSNCRNREEQIALAEQAMDDAFVEKRTCSTRVKECEIQIKQYEDYLNRPEKEQLLQAISEEAFLRNYFEEELSLKLVLERGSRTLFECAREAVGVIREGDKNRESGDMLNALYQVYQRHNGSLASYGTALEDCFGTVDDIPGVAETANILRKRVRVVSVWNGKKVCLEEFYGILKTAIDETELLIQKKDSELFEDILSQTISQQLTDRIEESRRWVSDMSRLMKEMDTSMGLSFSLDWKPRKAENDTELDTAELEQILLRDRALLTMEDIEKVSSHFRSKIRTEKRKLEEEGGVINYMDLVRDALDYRKWFEFHMFFRRGEEVRKPLTNAAFNRFSGGEKAMAMYVPLFAAVNAQYQKAENKDHPRMLALDEAFAGVDDKNISSMFELVHKLDFDYIMNSQALWGCFETVKGLRIAELLRPQNSQTVSVIRYTWNGHERILDEQ